MVSRLEADYLALARSCIQSFPRFVLQEHPMDRPQLLRKQRIVRLEALLEAHFRG